LGRIGYHCIAHYRKNYQTMNQSKYLFVLIITLCTSIASMAQIEDHIYDPNIKSVQMIIGNQPAIVPILGLNRGNTSFTLRFDQLGEDANEYFYKVVHCDRNWNPSDIEEIEYLEGFNDEEIRDYEFSVNTYVDYVHFALTLPNEDTKFRISGNYVLTIFEGEDMTVPVITRRFMINEGKAKMFVDFQRTTDVTLSRTHQQLDVEVDMEGLRIGDPKNELSIDIIQNNRWDNMISNEKPKFLSRNRAQFDNTGRLTLPGGKEFRQFDIRSLQYAIDRVSHIDLHDFGSDVTLHYVKPRGYNEHRTEIDFDGRFITAIHEFDDDNVRADYANVEFKLEGTQNLDETYVIGPFTDWRINEDYKMSYKAAALANGDGRMQDVGYYQLITKLKQGYYNYLLCTKGKDGKPNYDLLEGNSNRTLNYYTVIVYYNDFVQDFDRILGIQQVTTENQFR